MHPEGKMIGDRKKGLNVVLMGLLGYASFSFCLLWNRMNLATLMIILSSFVFIGVCFYVNYLLNFKSNPLIFVKCVLFTYFLYLSSKFFVLFLHETGHAIAALIYGVPLIEIRIISFLQGFTVVGDSNPMIVISGSLGIIIILILLLIGLVASRKDLKTELFIPVYVVISLHLFEEIRYWYTSILNRFGDGWEFIKLYLRIDYVNMLFIINGILWTGTIILLIILVYPSSKRFIKKITIRNYFYRRTSRDTLSQKSI